MIITQTYFAKDRQEWRSWLEKHYDKEKNIWLIIYKKHVEKSGVPYKDSVEEALCFGWIDSTTKRIDDEKYVQRFSPRKKISPWSAPNILLVKRLIADGKMTKAGLKAFEAGNKSSLLK